MKSARAVLATLPKSKERTDLEAALRAGDLETVRAILARHQDTHPEPPPTPKPTALRGWGAPRNPLTSNASG